MARYLILPLLLMLTLVGALFYVGSAQWVLFEVLPQSPDVSPQKGFAMSAQAAILAGTALVGGIVALSALVIWLRRLPKRVKSGFGRHREANGLDAVEQALIAGETGDGDLARKKARKARDLLDRPALTGLVSAKAAEAAGNAAEAEEHYTMLLDNPDTKLAGLRGLARLSEHQGDYDNVIEMAKTAYAPPKGPKWAFDHLFGAQISLNDWDGALETLDIAEKRKQIDKENSRRRRAVLLAAQATGLEQDGQIEAAIEAAQRSATLSPGFAPANALAARLLSQNGQTKKAAGMIEKAWGRAPHPALALAYRDVFAGEPQKVQDKKIKALIKTNSAHRESSILSAEQALQNKDGVSALQALGELLREEDPSARLCALASAAEDMLGNPIDARAWHRRALSAPVEADWSDLDPDGPDFKYTDKDWQRLVLSYGETGTLIHPRYEAHKRRRSVFVDGGHSAPGSADEIPPENLVMTDEPSPDDPGISMSGDSKEDLSKRLDNLLDGDNET